MIPLWACGNNVGKIDKPKRAYLADFWCMFVYTRLHSTYIDGF